MNFDPAQGDPAHNHPQSIGELWYAVTFFHPDLANRLSAVDDESHVSMPAANLEVTWVSGTPAVVAPGGSLAITDTTANTGYVSVGEPSTTRFYLSTDDVITPADIRIGERVVPNIAGGRADRTTTSIVIPAGVPPGTYFIGACADGPGVIFESNESDNCTASSERVRIVEPAVAPSAPTELGQFKADGTTPLPVGAWTNQASVVLRLAMSDASHTDSLVPEVELKPVNTAFNGSGLHAGAPVASTGAPVPGSVTVTGLSNGVAYHWRARVRDAGGQVSAWVSFGGNAETEPRRRRRPHTAVRLGQDRPQRRVERLANRVPGAPVHGCAEWVRRHAAQQRQRRIHAPGALRGDADVDARGGRRHQDRLRPLRRSGRQRVEELPRHDRA